MQVLILEDDLVLSSEIIKFLSAHQMDCHLATDGEMLLKKANEQKYDIFLLDINVPKINGLDVCQKIREKDVTTPIIILSAYDALEDKKEAFQRAADDYMTKPFLLEELLLRINSQLRNKMPQDITKGKIIVEDLEIYLDDSKVYRGGQEINLTMKEFQLLVLLAESKGRTLSKQYISDKVWKNQFQSTNNAIEVYINFLRKKIDKNFSLKLIHTRPGFGYYLSPL